MVYFDIRKVIPKTGTEWKITSNGSLKGADSHPLFQQLSKIECQPLSKLSTSPLLSFNSVVEISIFSIYRQFCINISKILIFNEEKHLSELHKNPIFFHHSPPINKFHHRTLSHLTHSKQSQRSIQKPHELLRPITHKPSTSFLNIHQIASSTTKRIKPANSTFRSVR